MNPSEPEPLDKDPVDPINAPAEPYGKLFLRFGLLAWGGPVAQIDMIRQELVAHEKWLSPGHFKRLLAIYQVLAAGHRGASHGAKSLLSDTFRA